MIPKDCRYTNEHEWIRPDGPDHVKIGITDYAQGALGDIVFVELPSTGLTLTQMQPFGTIEAVKTVSDLFSPIDGEVVEVNEAVKSDPSIVNKSPHGEGWMIRARLARPGQMDDLLTPEAYEEIVRGLDGGA
ncbi:MAG: glycine cleavage system protein GcvH [Candidatus Eisenbacteria bacterium]|nr:glycine cleavage system protein GcvH [Candidatus Eisenbacteria bacterium]